MAKQFLKILVTGNEVPHEGKALVYRMPADHYGENKEFNDCGVGWLFLPTLENLEKEHDMLRILKLLA